MINKQLKQLKIKMVFSWLYIKLKKNLIAVDCLKSYNSNLKLNPKVKISIEPQNR